MVHAWTLNCRLASMSAVERLILKVQEARARCSATSAERCPVARVGARFGTWRRDGIDPQVPSPSSAEAGNAVSHRLPWAGGPPVQIRCPSWASLDSTLRSATRWAEERAERANLPGDVIA